MGYSLDPRMSTSRSAGLDGLRAIAALAVVGHHAFEPPIGQFVPWQPGAAGVRLFFVLSGYLITGILADALADGERWVVWRAFVIRRALRIFPLAYLAIAIAWLVGEQHVGWYAAYLGNVHGVIAGDHHDWRLDHFWSLAIEEHFYLVWPLLLMAVPRAHWRSLTLVLILLVVFILRPLTGLQYGVLGAYSLTWSRADALLFGGWLALGAVDVRRVALVAVGTFLVGSLLPPALGFTFTEAAIVIASGCLVIVVARGHLRWLTWSPLVYLGTISYGLYVWHYLIGSQVSGPWRLPVMLFGSLACSVASWYLLEAPLNRLKELFPYRVSPVARTASVPAPLLPAPR